MKQRTVIYLGTNHMSSIRDTYATEEEATVKAQELLAMPGVVRVDMHIYSDHVLRGQKRMTRKRPYWH